MFFYITQYPCACVIFPCIFFIQYVSRQTPLLAEEVEFLAVKGYHSSNDEKLTLNPSSLMNDLDSSPLLVDPCRYDLQILQAEETLGGVKAICTSSRDHLVSRHYKGYCELSILQALLRSLLFTIAKIKGAHNSSFERILIE